MVKLENVICLDFEITKFCPIFSTTSFTIPGYFYQAYTDQVNYIDAVLLCRDKGGDIAMPLSYDNNVMIQKAYTDTGETGSYWIGVQVLF